MRRSEINAAVKEARAAFARHGWTLPPSPRWDVTDFGLGDFSRRGLTLVNLSEHPEYCEKLMYCRAGQETPWHYHRSKKEDIICRVGALAIELRMDAGSLRITVNGAGRMMDGREPLLLAAGERVTLEAGMRHRFQARSAYAILGEVSTANDDAHDNFFDDPTVGRFGAIVEDEPPLVWLVSDRQGA